MENISTHISWNEATQTNTGLPNIPNDTQLKAMKLLATKVFEPLRVLIGGPIKINSFYRSSAVNKKIGGSKTSQHCANNGAAIDLDGIGITNAKLGCLIMENLDFDQLIFEKPTSGEPAWIHVSYREGRNRGQVLIFHNKKYLPYKGNENLVNK